MPSEPPDRPGNHPRASKNSGPGSSAKPAPTSKNKNPSSVNLTSASFSMKGTNPDQQPPSKKKRKKSTTINKGRHVQGKTAKLEVKTSKASAQRGREEEHSPNFQNESEVQEPTLTKSAPNGEEPTSDAPPEKRAGQADQDATEAPSFWLFNLSAEQVAYFESARSEKKQLDIRLLRKASNSLSFVDIVFFFGERPDIGLAFLGFGTLRGSGTMGTSPTEVLVRQISFSDVEYLSPPIGLDRLRKEGFGTMRSYGYGDLHRIRSEDINAISSVLQSEGYESPFDNQRLKDINEPTPDALADDGLSETLRSLDDTPTAEDMLGRRPMAEAISERLNLIWRRASKTDSISVDPWTIHLNAPWGAGKTSFFNLLKEALTRPGESSDREPWIIIEYNAWHHRHVDPAWWSLYQEVFRQGAPQASGWTIDIKINEWWRRIWSGRKLYALSIIIVIIPLFLIWSSDSLAIYLTENLLSKEAGEASVLQIWTGFGGLIGSIFSAAGIAYMTLFGGTANHARRFHNFTRDPQITLRKNFRALIKDFRRPVLIFIDDIDRCDAAFVTDLLESLMTVLRSNRAFYLIAGDGFWINRCFETAYKDFKGLSRDPGRSLGHNFLEKVFQTTITLPSLNPKIKERFWRSLLGEDQEPQISRMSDGDDASAEKLQTGRSKKVAAEVEEMLSKIKVALEDYEKEETDEITERFLSRFHPLIESNPRAMKRLVNAYVMGAIRRTTELGRELSIEEKCKLALWVIFTHRWPRVVDYLTRHRAEIATIIPWAKSGENADETGWRKELPEILRQQQAMSEVLNGKYLTGDGPALAIEVGDVEEFLGAARPISGE